jgi:hypothetical protein
VRPSILLLASVVLTASLHAADIPTDYSSPQNLNDVINRYQRAQSDQQAALRETQMVEDIEASIPKLEKQSKVKVLHFISKLGINTFQMIGTIFGDKTVFNEVIARYLETEQKGRENGSLAIIPENYKFKINAIVTQDSHTTYIFNVTPKRKDYGLFKGQVWLDGGTAMPLKEVGQLVKSPSVWLKSVKFERDYEIHDGIAVPTHLESRADVHLFGTAKLTANFSNLKRLDSTDATGDAVGNATGNDGP